MEPVDRGTVDFYFTVLVNTNSITGLQFQFTLEDAGSRHAYVTKHGVLAEVLEEPITIALPLMSGGRQVGGCSLMVELQSYPIGGPRAPSAAAAAAEQAFFIPEASAPAALPAQEPGAPAASGAAGAAQTAVLLTMLGEPVPLVKLVKSVLPLSNPVRNLNYLKAWG
jgi:hypothetical protein